MDNIENPKELQTITVHTSDVTSCDFAPNFTFVTGSSDKTVRLWDWTPGVGYAERPCSPLRGHKYGVTCVRISPQGTMLATSSIDGSAVLWNLESGVRLATLVQANGDAIRVCRFAPDSSTLITGGDNGAICVWDLVHRSLIRTIYQHEGTTQGLTFTPDSQYLISACSLEVMRVWLIQDLVDTTTDTTTCSPLSVIDNSHDLGVFSLDVSSIVDTDPDDPFRKQYTMAAAGNNDIIKIWTLTATSTPKHRQTKSSISIRVTGAFEGHTSAITSVRYNSAGNYLVSASIDKTVKVWDQNGACLCTLVGHGRYVNCAAFSRDSTLVGSGSNDKSIVLWDLAGDLTLDSPLVKDHLMMMRATAAERTAGIQEEYVVADAEGTSNIVELLEKVDEIAEGAINSCCFHGGGGGLLATGSGDKLVKVFKLCEENNYSLEELNCSPLEKHSYPVNCVDFNNEGLLASCSMDGSSIITDPMSGDVVATLPNNSGSIRVCKFSPDGSMLATAGDDEIATVWDYNSLEPISILEGHSDAITSLSFSPDSKIIVTACNNADYRIWALNDGHLIHIQDCANDLGIQSCDFSQNLEPIPNVIQDDLQNYLLATCGNDSLVKLWRIFIEKDEDEFNFDETKVKQWRILQGHGGSVTCVKFSPNSGEIICSTASDRQARIWSVYSGFCLHVLDHDSIVTACAFSANCALLATGSLDKTLWIWKLPIQLVFQSAVANKIKIRRKAPIDWTKHDTSKWLIEISFEDISEQAVNGDIDGQALLTLTDEELQEKLEIDDEQLSKLMKEIRWLKMDENKFKTTSTKTDSLPEDFFCPITHEVMMEPVVASDGFTYERRAITEWFLAGKYSSPMTNCTLETTDVRYNNDLRSEIHNYLYEEE